MNIYKKNPYKKNFFLIISILLMQNMSPQSIPTTPPTQSTPPTSSTPSIPKIEEKILKYGDRIRLRFANLAKKALHSHEINYYHQNSSRQQQVTGYLNPASGTQYQPDQDEEEWIILGPSAMYDQYLQGQPVTPITNIDGTITAPSIRLYHPKTKKYLHYHFNTTYKAPLSTSLLEVTATNEPFGNLWQINTIANTNERKEIIYGKTLFTIEAQNGLPDKYLTTLQNDFRLTADVTNPLRHPIVGLSNTPVNWFVESITEIPQPPPIPEIIPEIVEEKPTEGKPTGAIISFSNIMWGINSFEKALSRQNITTENPQGQSWTYPLSTGIDVKIIQNITIGPQNTVWAIDHLGQLYYREGASSMNLKGTTWSAIKDSDIIKFYDISAGANGLVWAISTERKVYYRLGITTLDFKGISWIEIPLIGINPNDYPEQISVAPNGNVAIVTINGNLYHRIVTTENPSGASWNKVTSTGLVANEQIKQISLGLNGKTWALSNNQRIYFISDIKNPQLQWNEVTGGLISQIYVAPNNVVYGVNANGKLYIRREITQNNPVGTRWENISSNILKVSLSPNGRPYCITRGQYSFYPENQLTFSQFTGNKISFLNQSMQWESIPLENITSVELEAVTINSQGMVFALDKFFNSYYRTNVTEQNPQGSNWIKFDSHQPLTLALGETKNGSTLWGTNIAGSPQKVKSGITATSPLGTIEIPELTPPFLVKQFAPGPNDIIWALSSQPKNEDDFIPYYKKEAQWIADLSIGMKQLSLEKTPAGICLWGTTSDNKVFLKKNITSETPQGDAWQEIMGKKIKQIFVSPNGTVWGLSTEEHYKYKENFWLYYREGITQTNAEGTSWEAVNSAISALPGFSANYLKYGDKISLCVALNEQNPTFKGGAFVDTENLLAFCNGPTGKKTQELEIINPTNIADKSLVKYNAPVIFKTDKNKYLGIVNNTFLNTNVGFPQNAAQFIFANINPKLSDNLPIQYGSKVGIKSSNKNLNINNVSYLNSNLILETESKYGSNLFVVLKPVNSEIPIEQSEIDKIETHLSLIIKQLNKNWTNVLTNSQNTFAQIIATLHSSQAIIPSNALTIILQICVAEGKETLIAKNQRDYITQTLIPTIKNNAGSTFQPLVVTIINQLKDNLGLITKPEDGIVKFLEIFINNKNLMTQDERNDLKGLLTLVYTNATFLNAAQKNKILGMINALGGIQTTTVAIPTIPL